jgi:hypothetical protein
METKIIVLSDELKAKLRKCTAISIKSNFKYIPEIYRKEAVPKEYIPVFTLKGLDGLDKLALEDILTESISIDKEALNGSNEALNEGDVKFKIKAGLIKKETVKKGLLGWRNLLNDKFELIPNVKFTKSNPCTDEYISYLSPELIAELYMAITNESTLTEEELMGLE